MASLRHWLRLVGAASPGARVLELDGVQAAVVPAAPQRSVVNSVVYEDAGALRRSLTRLADAYEDAGVRAWTVWAPAGDREAAGALEEAGHVLDASPEAMACETAHVAPPEAPPELSFEIEPAEVGRINDRSYPFGDDSFARALERLSGDGLHLYGARLDGEPVATVVTCEHDGDCGVELVATVPEARGRGLATALLRRAVADARERGCTSTSLVATTAGRPVYERLGYRPLGAIDMWERRRRLTN
jgi:GNAT superfamily N-acetyltransferase